MSSAVLVRQLFIISDLHLGGIYADPPDSGRGFRICTRVAALAAFIDTLTARPADGPATELVINGDIVDFLAEREDDPPHFTPFTADPAAAVAKLDAIVARDRTFFDALGRFLDAGHRLVVLLGNHDLELVLPTVRARLAHHLGVKGAHDYVFIHDGEAYIAGDALIEHGNRYDRWNVVDQDALRRVRSLLSRRQDIPDQYAFDPPAGSKMVAQVINQIKQDYKFIDLLKPETGAVIPLLLAIEPGYRKLLSRAAQHALQARKHRLAAAALPGFGGDIASDTRDQVGDFGGDISGGVTATGSDADLETVLHDVLGDDAEAFLREADPTADIGGDISAMDTIDRAIGLFRMATAKAQSDYGPRLRLLLRAFRALQDDRTFDESVETDPTYLEAARDLAQGGIRHVVFGHTHMARKIPLEGGGFYMNSGTWADVMQFPEEIISGDDTAALAKVTEFVERMVANDFSAWTIFRPTSVRLDLDADNTVQRAELVRHDT